MDRLTRRPMYRSRIRLAAGHLFYALLRYLQWFRCSSFAKEYQKETLPNVQTQHATPLLRQLRGLEMTLQYNKVKNLQLAVKKINGIVLHPGEILSYWKTIGNPTAKKGYLPGMVLVNGKVTAGIGGGLCQLSNLIYWMTLHTPLTVVERHHHGYDVFPDSNRSQPFGSGATCFYPYGDLVIRNDTDRDFQLCLYVGETDLCGEWRSTRSPQEQYRIIEKNHCMQGEYWGGFTRHNELWREVSNFSGNFLREEFIVENHVMMMYEPFLQSANPQEGAFHSEKGS